MKPAVPLALERLSELLSGELAPVLETSFAGQQVLRMAGLLPAAAIEFDRAAARLVEENRALRHLFAQALDQVDDAVLAADLAGVPGDDPDLRVSALGAANDRLRRLLIRLQAWCESRQDEASLALAERIWQELRRQTERRALPIDRL